MFKLPKFYTPSQDDKLSALPTLFVFPTTYET
jgi:hypothetical protein